MFSKYLVDLLLRRRVKSVHNYLFCLIALFCLLGDWLIFGLMNERYDCSCYLKKKLFYFDLENVYRKYLVEIEVIRKNLIAVRFVVLLCC